MISRKTLLLNVAGFFLSAKELKERGFKFFKLLVLFFFPVGNQTQTSPRPTLNHAFCNVYSPNVVET